MTNWKIGTETNAAHPASVFPLRGLFCVLSDNSYYQITFFAREMGFWLQNTKSGQRLRCCLSPVNEVAAQIVPE